MSRKLLTASEFGAVAREGEALDAMVSAQGSFDAKAMGDTSTSRFVFSDGGLDHDGDTISPSGWDLSLYARNSVVLWAHDASSPPVGKASNVVVQNGRLVGDITFPDGSVYGFGALIGRLVKGGYLNAVSVGFKPTKWAFATERNRQGSMNFLQQQLLEVSVCPVPANPRALVEARSMGIDTGPLVQWAEKVLDGETHVTVARTEIEKLRQQAAVSERVHYVAGLRANLKTPRPTTREERMREAEEIARRLKESEARTTASERIAQVNRLRAQMGI